MVQCSRRNDAKCGVGGEGAQKMRGDKPPHRRGGG